MKLLLCLYPGWWRKRYGAEALDILQDHPITAATVLDVLGGALDAWLNQKVPPGSANGSGLQVVEVALPQVDARTKNSGPAGITFAASVGVTAVACIACLLAGSLEWGDRANMVGVDSAEAAEQARFAIELYAIAAVNFLAGTLFVLRRSGLAWWLLLGVQLGIVALTMVEGTLTDPGWFFFSSIPVSTSILLFALRQAPGSLNPPLPGEVSSSGR